MIDFYEDKGSLGRKNGMEKIERVGSLRRYLSMFLAVMLFVVQLFPLSLMRVHAATTEPSNITVVPTEDNKGLVLSWTNPDDTRFGKTRIYRQAGSSTGSWGTSLGEVTKPSSTYTDNPTGGLKPYTTYYYKLEAMTSSGILIGTAIVSGQLDNLGPITFSKWTLDNGGVANLANVYLYPMNAEFYATEDITKIDYQYSTDGVQWKDIMVVINAPVKKGTGLDWSRGVKVDLHDLPEGDVQVKATATSANGSTLSNITTFNKDTVRPGVVTNIVSDVSVSGKQTLTWVNPASDFKYVDIHRRVVGVNSSWSSMKAAFTGTTFTTTDTIDGLTYDYRFTTVDSAGNATSEPTIVAVQNPMNGPVLEELKPNETIPTKANSISYSAKFRDHSPVKTILMEVSTDGVSWTPINENNQTPSASNHYFSISGTYNLENYGETDLHFRATATDALGRKAVGTRLLKVDRVIPIAPPNFKATMQPGGVLVEWDPVPGVKKYRIGLLEDRIYGIAPAAWFIDAPGTSYLIPTSVTKPFTYVISAEDFAGNVGPESMTSVDRFNGPSLSLTRGKEVFVNQANYQLNGQTEPGATVKVNNQTVTVAENGSFSYGVTLVTGQQDFTVTSTNTNGTHTLIQRVILDQDSPVITKLNPADDTVLKGYSQDLNFDFKDMGISAIDKIEYQISLTDGQSWNTFKTVNLSLADQAYRTTYYDGSHRYYWNTLEEIPGIGQLQDGPYKFRVMLTDRAGNVSNGIPVRVWVIDNKAYRATINTPTGFKVENKIEEVALSWVKNVDTYTSKYRILRSISPDGEFVEIGTTTNATYSDKTVFHGTKYYYKIQALTAVGVESAPTGVLEAEALKDTIAPIITYFVPAEGGTLGGTRPYADLNINENSRKGVTKFTQEYSRDGGETWHPIPGEIVGPNTNWQPYPKWYAYWDTAGFEPGAYRLKYTIQDFDGNVTVKQVNVNLDLFAETPQPTITSLDGEVRMTWNSISASDYDNIKIYRASQRDGFTTSALSTISTQSTLTYVDKGVTPGNTYFYKLRFTDKAGNFAETDAIPILVVDDAQKPIINSISPADGTTMGGDTNSINGSFSDNRSVSGSKAEYSTDGVNWVHFANGNHQSSTWYHSWNTKNLAEGTYQVRISVWDAAGNTQTQIMTYFLDKTVSKVQNFEAVPEENAILLKWTPVTDPDLDSWPYEILRATTPGGPYTSVASAWIYPTDSQYRINGLDPTIKYYFIIRAKDKYKNVSTSAEISSSYLEDTTAPIVTRTTPATGVTIGGASTQELKVFYRDNAGYIGNKAYFEYSNDGKLWQEVPGILYGPNVSGTEYYFYKNWSLTNVPSGTYQLRYNIEDASGNKVSETVIYEVDRTPPGPPQNLIGRYGEGKVNLTWEKPVAVDLKDYYLYRATSANGPFAKVDATIGKTAVSFTDTSIQVGLTYYYKLTARDTFNQEGSESNVAAAYAQTDSVKPTVTSISPITGTILSATKDIIVTGVDNLSISSFLLQYSFDGQIWEDLGTRAANSSNTATFNLESLDYHGNIWIRAVAYDSFGNASTESPVRQYFLDREGPEQVTGVTAIPGETSAFLQWNAVAATDFDYYVVEKKGPNEAEFKSIGGDITSPKVNVTGLVRESVYQFRVVAYDERGNRGTPSEVISVTTIYDVVAPAISEITPGSGSFDDLVQVTVKATDNIGIVGMKLQYSLDRVEWADIETVEGKSIVTFNWNTASLPEGTYYVRALAWDGVGNVSDETTSAKYVKYELDHTAPAVLTGLAASVSDYSISLTWEASAAADLAGYNVYRAENVDGHYTRIAAKKVGNSYVDVAVVTNKVYYYKVSAVDKAGLESLHSSSVNAQLPSDVTAPSVFGITPDNGAMLGSNPKLKFSVNDNYRLADVFVQYREKGSETWLPLTSQTVTGRSATVEYTWDTSALSEGNYEVRYQVVDASGLSSEWSLVEYVLNMFAPEAPVLTGEPGGWSASLSWSSNQEWDFKEYRVYRSLVSDSDFTKIYTATRSNHFVDNTVQPGIRYYYKVEAVDTYGNASTSNVINVVPTNEDSVLPVAKIEYTGNTYLGDLVPFSALKSSDNVRIDRYEWNFGDGKTSQIAEPVHAFETEGTFTITLKVYDPKGNSAVASVDITVVDQPAKPVGLVADSGDGKAYLSWSPNAETDVVGYYVYWFQNGSWQKVTNSLLTQPSYLVSDLTNGTEYSFAVTALNEKGIESEKSQYENVTPAVQEVLKVDEAIASNTGKRIVEGYIVGTTSTVSTALPYDFEDPFTVPTTILLADSPNETRESHILVVHLSSGVVRGQLNLVDLPQNLGDKILIKGDLGAYLTKPGITNVQLYEFTYHDQDDVAADAAALAVGFAEGDSAEAVTSNVALAVTGLNGSMISWSSSDAIVVSTNGVVIRPAYGAGDKDVTLSATIRKGNAVETKTFVITVKEEEDKTPPTVSVDLPGGTYQGAQTVTLTASEPGKIYYSLDGSEPTVESTVYSGPITISASASLKYFAVDVAGNASPVATAVYEIRYDAEDVAADKAALELGFGDGDSASSVTKYISLVVLGEKGSAISWASSDAATVSTSGIVTRPANGEGDKVVTLTATIQKGAVVETKVFVVTVKQLPDTTPPTVFADLAGGIYVGPQTVKIITSEPATIYYTLDGSEPTTSSTIYSGSITISKTTLLKYFAVDGAGNASFIGSVQYTIHYDADDVAADKAALELGFAEGDSASSVTKDITLAVLGEKGSAISWSSSDTAVISETGVVNRPEAGAGDKEVTLTATLQKGEAIETKQFVVIVKQLLDLTGPVVSVDVVGGTYFGPQTVTITASEPSTIYYTLDGSEPSSSSTVYTDPILISTSLTLKYFAVDVAGNESEVQTQVYEIKSPATGWIENDHPSIVYTGYWSEVGSNDLSGGSYHYGNNSNSVELVFEGSGIRWIGTKSPFFGLADIYIDGQLIQEINLYSADTFHQSKLFEIKGLADGIHTIKIVNKDTLGDPAGVGKFISVDAFDIIPNGADATAPSVSVDVAGGTYTDVQTISLTASEPATIYYTLDGSDPTIASNVYSGPITIYSTTTLKYFAVDTAGNESVIWTQIYTLELPVSGGWLEENHADIVYSGLWTSFESGDYSGGSYKFGGGRNNSAELTFAGSGIRWIASTSAKHGLADVYIDGQLVGEVNLYSEEIHYQQVVFEATGLSNGVHTIRIVKKNLPGHPNGKDTNINVDAFEVVPFDLGDSNGEDGKDKDPKPVDEENPLEEKPVVIVEEEGMGLNKDKDVVVIDPREK
jgi:fibronectin type 3 domain-containing protein